MSARGLHNLRFPYLFLDFHFSFIHHAQVEPPFIIAHRGGGAMAPENTLEGWSLVKRLYKPDVFELDVRVSADGHLVVIHDKKVDRTTDGSGKVKSMTLRQLKKLDAAYWFTQDNGISYPWRSKGVRIPLLEEVLDRFGEDRFNIEIKKTVPGIEYQLARMILNRRMQDKVLVLSMDKKMLKRLRHYAPEIRTASVLSEKTLIARVARTRFKSLIRGLINRAHRRGVQVEVWTVNRPRAMRMLLELGVDGLVTDYPDVALNVMRQMGLRPDGSLDKIVSPEYVYVEDIDERNKIFDLFDGGYGNDVYGRLQWEEGEA